MQKRMKSMRCNVVPGWLMKASLDMPRADLVVLSATINLVELQKREAVLSVQGFLEMMGNSADKAKNPAYYGLLVSAYERLCKERYLLEVKGGKYFPGTRVLDGYEKGMWDKVYVDRARALEAELDLMVAVAPDGSTDDEDDEDAE